MISARAFGIFMYLQNNPEHISADHLAGVFSEGRRAILTALSELREAGLLVTKTQQINGSWVTFSFLPECGFGTSVDALLLQLNVQNSNNSVNANSYKTLMNPPTASVNLRESDMGYDFFDKTSSMDRDERIAERDRNQQRQKAAYAEQREATRSKRYISRKEIARSSWTVSDVAYEFADKIQQHWHIKPFTVVQSRFVPALSAVRKQHDTNGDIEVEVMNRFFDSISINQYDDPEVLWKMFIKRFPSIVMQVKNMATEDVSEDAKVRTAKGLSKLED